MNNQDGGTKQQARIKAAGTLAGEHSDVKMRNQASTAAVQVEFTSSDRRTKQLLVAEGLTNAGGAHTLVANAAGTYRVRVRRNWR